MSKLKSQARLKCVVLEIGDVDVDERTDTAYACIFLVCTLI